jgi:transcriptional regulator with XRE-family HTH domain
VSFDLKAFGREVGLLLQLTRKKKGITQEELAERIGIPRATYANVESGRQRPPLDIVWRASIVLGVALTSLVPEPLPPPANATRRESPGETTTNDLSSLLRNEMAV